MNSFDVVSNKGEKMGITNECRATEGEMFEKIAIKLYLLDAFCSHFIFFSIAMQKTFTLFDAMDYV